MVQVNKSQAQDWRSLSFLVEAGRPTFPGFAPLGDLAGDLHPLKMRWGWPSAAIPGFRPGLAHTCPDSTRGRFGSLSFSCYFQGSLSWEGEGYLFLWILVGWLVVGWLVGWFGLALIAIVKRYSKQLPERFAYLPRVSQ